MTKPDNCKRFWDDKNTQILSKDQTGKVFRVLMSNWLKMQDAIRAEVGKERASLYSG